MRLKLGPKAECTNCGAPLEISKDATDVRCTYCGQTLHVERARRIPPKEEHKPVTVYVKSGLPAAIIWFIVITGVLPAVIPIAIFVVPLLFQLVAAGSVGLPAVCPMNGALEISGQNWKGDGAAITAELNCKVKIQGSHLSGTVGVLAKGNVEVVIEDSEIEGSDAALQLDVNSKVLLAKKTVVRSPEVAISGTTNVEVTLDDARVEAGKRAFEGGVNPKVRLVHGSRMKSGGSGVRADSNLELVLDGSELYADEVAVRAEANPKVRLLRGARIHGGRGAIRAGSNLDLDVDDATVEGGPFAVCGGYGAKIDGTKGTIAGDTFALRLAHRPKELELSGTVVRGQQVFDAPDCSVMDAAFVAATPREVSPSSPRSRPTRPAAAAGVPVPVPAERAAPFDTNAAVRGLDAAQRNANASCRSSTGRPQQIWVVPGFSPDGSNGGAQVGDVKFRGTPEAQCVERIFRTVRIPPFDPATRPSGLMRPVDLR